MLRDHSPVPCLIQDDWSGVVPCFVTYKRPAYRQGVVYLLKQRSNPVHGRVHDTPVPGPRVLPLAWFLLNFRERLLRLYGSPPPPISLRLFRNHFAISQKQTHNMKRIHLVVTTPKMMERRRDTMCLKGVRYSFPVQACASSEPSDDVSKDELSALAWRASTNSGPMWKHIREPLV